MLGALAAVPLPAGFGPAPPARGPDPLQAALLARFAIEAPVFSWPAPAVRVLRVSAQLYNAAADYERLVDALTALRTGR
jgi:isopenicillin-N epimerase